jgi:hypothetical protein
MSEETIRWIFVPVFLWLITLTKIWWDVKNDVKNLKLAVDLFIGGMGKAAALVIHRDDDRYGIDALLDRYRAHDNDLSLEDWITLKTLMDKFQNDSTVPDGTKLAVATVCFAMLAEFATHKIHGRNPAVKEAIKQALQK